MTQNNFGIEGPYTKAKRSLFCYRRAGIVLIILAGLLGWGLLGFLWFNFFGT